MLSTSLPGCGEGEEQADGGSDDVGVSAKGAAVPYLAAPPESVLASQRKLLAMPAGYVRTGDGRIVCRKDGAEMVLVQSAEFTMGSDEGRDDEAPPHRVRLSAFLVDRHEVTNAQFAKFVAQTGHRSQAEQEGKAPILVEGGAWPDIVGADWMHPRGPSSSIPASEHDPVVLVSWKDARAFADWAGRRLLTEAEFEYCLRGTLDGMRYPWGDAELPPANSGNYGDEALRRLHLSAKWAHLTIDGYDDGFERVAPVGSFSQNALGLFDVSGNVWEWCADWFDLEYYATSPARDPTGPSGGDFRTRRGGGWSFGLDALRCSRRDGNVPEWTLDTLGFRCCSSLP